MMLNQLYALLPICCNNFRFHYKMNFNCCFLHSYIASLSVAVPHLLFLTRSHVNAVHSYNTLSTFSK